MTQHRKPANVSTQAKPRATQLGRKADGKGKGRRLSLDNPPTGFTMSVDQLAELTNCGRIGAYDAVKRGVYPSIRQGRMIKVLTVPTLAILRGEVPPGQPTR